MKSKCLSLSQGVKAAQGTSSSFDGDEDDSLGNYDGESGDVDDSDDHSDDDSDGDDNDDVDDTLNCTNG